MRAPCAPSGAREGPSQAGLDVHRKQITFDYLDTATGEMQRGQIAPADRAHLAAWLARRFPAARTRSSRWRGAPAGGGPSSPCGSVRSSIFTFFRSFGPHIEHIAHRPGAVGTRASDAGPPLKVAATRAARGRCKVGARCGSRSEPGPERLPRLRHVPPARTSTTLCIRSPRRPSYIQGVGQESLETQTPGNRHLLPRRPGLLLDQ